MLILDTTDTSFIIEFVLKVTILELFCAIDIRWNSEFEVGTLWQSTKTVY